MTLQGSYILLDDQLTHTQRYYANPIDIIIANAPVDVAASFEKIMHYHRQGYHLAGYLSYEAGLIFEPKLLPLLPKDRATPLLQFGVFETVSDTPPTHYLYSAHSPDLKLSAAWSQDEYLERFKIVKDYIEAGDVYQINLTFPMTGHYEGAAHTLYAAFRHQQKSRYGGIVSLGHAADIISLSPELFFRKEGPNMSMRPMKGTRPRSINHHIDEALREEMRGDEKSQAENLMIVDLLRNDLSKISVAGSVKVPELFAIETYPTLHQMTSRVLSKLKQNVDLEMIFKNLFPCGSVTGAPKIRAMEIIDALETKPRGAYCGSLGYIDPNGDACFNVSIRTLTLSNKALTYNVGSGLVMDSDASDEYKECLLKADVIASQGTVIIETFRWEPHKGFIRKQAHKARMKQAAKALKYPFNEILFDEAIKEVEAHQSVQHVRVTLDEDGTFNINTKDYTAFNNPKIVLSKHRLSDRVQNFNHKISIRNFYDGERERLRHHFDITEVIFLNEDNTACEGSFTSLFIEKDGQLLTPRLNAGLLPGILRAELIKSGDVAEADISKSDLINADKIFIGNSLRGLMRTSLISTSLH